MYRIKQEEKEGIFVGKLQYTYQEAITYLMGVQHNAVKLSKSDVGTTAEEMCHAFFPKCHRLLSQIYCTFRS
jgi:hypothetical protein